MDKFIPNKKTILSLFILLAIIQLTAAILPTIKSEMATLYGQEYKFFTTAYDPADPFRGRYLQFQIDTSSVDKDSEKALFPDQYDNYNQPCYLTIKTSAEGTAYFDQVLGKPPTDGSDYIKARYQYGIYDLPIGNYYVDEDIAPKAEKAFFENPDNNYIILNVYKGTSVVTGLYMGDFLIDEIQF